MLQQFTLENYQKVFTQESLLERWLFNSVVVASIVTGCNLILNSMAGYALARIRFRRNQILFFLSLVVLMIPVQVTLITSFLILKSLGG
jgi:multiple sugar transport system permease protein